MKKQYYYIDIHLSTKNIESHGITQYATHIGDTGKGNIHRVFLTKGQYNKLKAKI